MGKFEEVLFIVNTTGQLLSICSQITLSRTVIIVLAYLNGELYWTAQLNINPELHNRCFYCRPVVFYCTGYVIDRHV